MESKDWTRFWLRVNYGEHWLWCGALTPKGYGTFSPGKGRKTAYAHRLSYELSAGRKLKRGEQVDHICHVRNCVKPEHLRVASNKQNHEHLLGAHKDSESGVRGVFRDKRRNKWVARVHHNGKSYHVGQFDDLAEADRAVTARRNELFTHNDLDRVIA